MSKESRWSSRTIYPRMSPPMIYSFESVQTCNYEQVHSAQLVRHEGRLISAHDDDHDISSQGVLESWLSASCLMSASPQP